ncbi:MAG: response regulator [Planctomycetota bacterium]|jgi:CheY-like chemotaxis protein
MRLEAMTVGLLRRAVAIYQDLVWGADGPAPPELPGGDEDPIGTALPAFTDETLRSGENATARYALRLGNPNYPFMKLVLQEHLVEGEYFLSVDTHDQMFEADDPDERQALISLRRANLDIKDAVESAWSDAGLPTARQVKGLVEGWPTRREEPNGHSILLVDNDEDIAATLAMLLAARGYKVSVLHDGREAVEQADPAQHDLVLMDNEMKHVNGFEACRVLKSRERTRNLPVLIATAGSLTLQQLDAADGFLVKPFRMELLFSILEHMLGRRQRV